MSISNNLNKKIQLIRQCKLFKSLFDNDIKIMAKLSKYIYFCSHEYIIRKGSQNKDIFIIVNGLVKHGNETYLKASDYFGESCLLKDAQTIPLNVTDVISQTPVKCLVISRKDFLQISDPVMWNNVMKITGGSMITARKLEWDNFLKKKERERQRENRSQGFLFLN